MGQMNATATNSTPAGVSAHGLRKTYGKNVVLDGVDLTIREGEVVDSLRALLTGAPVGSTAYLALAWCVAIALVGYIWTQAAFRRGAR